MNAVLTLLTLVGAGAFASDGSYEASLGGKPWLPEQKVFWADSSFSDQGKEIGLGGEPGCFEAYSPFETQLRKKAQSLLKKAREIQKNTQTPKILSAAKTSQLATERFYGLFPQTKNQKLQIAWVYASGVSLGSVPEVDKPCRQWSTKDFKELEELSSAEAAEANFYLRNACLSLRAQQNYWSIFKSFLKIILPEPPTPAPYGFFVLTEAVSPTEWMELTYDYQKMSIPAYIEFTAGDRARIYQDKTATYVGDFQMDQVVKIQWESIVESIPIDHYAILAFADKCPGSVKAIKELRASDAIPFERIMALATANRNRN